MHANTWPRTFVFWWVSPDHLQTEVIYNKLLSIYFSFKLRLHWFGRKLCVKSDYFICEGSLKIVKRALENTLITSGHGVTWGWKLLLLVVLGCLHVPELRLKSWKANQMILLIQPGQWRPPQLLTSDPGKRLHILLPNISQRRGWFFLLFLSRSCFSQWLGQNRICSTRMNPASLQELPSSHLASLDSPNDWLGKQIVGKTLSGCLNGVNTLSGHRKDKGKCFLLEHVHICCSFNSKYVCRGDGRIRKGVIRKWPAPHHFEWVLFFSVSYWLISPQHGSCLIQRLGPFHSVSDPFRQNDQLVAYVKSSSMTTFKYWLVWE